MNGDRQGNGRSAISSPPPRAEDRIDAPPQPADPGTQVPEPGRSRRFARPGAGDTGLAPPPRPAQAADTLYMPPPSAADRTTASMPMTPPAPARVLPPPNPAHRVGPFTYPPPLAAHQVAGPPRRRRRIVRTGPPWLGPALLAAVGVLLIGAGIGFGAHAIFGGKHHKKAPTAVATPGRRPPTTSLTPVVPPKTPTTPTGPATVSPGAGAQGSKSNGKAGKSPSLPGVGVPSTGGAVSSWPSGKSAWTVVLASTGNRSAAEAKAKQASGRGISAGVLNSSDYSSLRHGYWVAFAGQYGSASEAAAAAKRDASQGFAGAYARFVKP